MCSCVTISVFESTIKYLDLQQLLRREWYMHDTLMVSNLWQQRFTNSALGNKKHTNIFDTNSHSYMQGVAHDVKSWMWCHIQLLIKQVCERKYYSKYLTTTWNLYKCHNIICIDLCMKSSLTWHSWHAWANYLIF